jgi:hypothetical protein
MSIWKRRWFLRRLTIALAVGAVAVPAAQARPAGIGPGETGYGPVSADAGTQVSQNGQGTNSPLYYKVRRETGSGGPLVGSQIGPAPVQVVGPETPNGFGWGDAAILAAAGFSAALLAAISVFAVRHRGRFARA